MNSCTDCKTVYQSIKRNHLDCLNRHYNSVFYKEGFWSNYINKQNIRLAIKKGNINIIQCMTKQGCSFDLPGSMWCAYSPVQIACKKGRLDILEYLYSLGCVLDELSAKACVEHSQYECLRFVISYLVSKGISIKDFLLTHIAAKRGNIKIVKYLIESGCGYDEYTFERALSNSHFECVKYLHSIKCKQPCGPTSMTYAVRSGNVKIVKKLFNAQLMIVV